MIFHQPSVWFLLLLLLTPLMWRRWTGRRARPAARFSSLAPAVRAGRTWAVRTQWILPVLRTLAFVALVVGLARPQKPDAQSRTLTEGIAIQLVLDRSSSMEALDFTLNGRPVDRLAAVCDVVRDFVGGADDLPGRPDDLVGLIAFARYPDAHAPLTLDHRHLIEQVDRTTIATTREEDGTAIGEALALGVERLRSLGERADQSGRHKIKSKIVILLTDGENNRGDIDPITAAELAASQGVKVYTIGAGSGSGFALVPVRDAFGRKRGTANQPVSIDEDSLKRIAKITGGQYYRATNTNSLRSIYKAIDELEKTTIEQRRYTRFHEAAIEPVRLGGLVVPPLLALAFVLLALETFLSGTRFRTLP